MKRIKLLMMSLAALLLFTSFTFSQTAVSDSGTVDNDQVYQKDVTFAGTLSGTDTSYTNPMKIENVADVFTLFYSTSNANDSVGVTLVRQVTGFAPSANKWIDEKTVFSAVDTSNNFAVSDTLVYKNKYMRYAIIGVSDNGYTTTWNLKAVFKKE